MVDAVRVGTRGSKLALRQAELVAEAVRSSHPGLDVPICIIETPADRQQDRPISHFGDKGVFVRAIEARLLDGEIDVAVHSLKDVPADVEIPGLVLAAFLPREDPRDVLVSRSGARLDRLPAGAVVGTSSPRRRVQLAALRPDLELREIRGNVDTRLRKVREGEYDAVVLAAAGLRRLGLEGSITEVLEPDRMLPDAGQGIVAVQVREGSEAHRRVAAIDDPIARCAAAAERALVRALNADCHSPVGALAEVQGDGLTLHGLAAAPDGSLLARVQERGQAAHPVSLGEAAARHLLQELDA